MTAKELTRLVKQLKKDGYALDEIIKHLEYITDEHSEIPQTE
jgi:hypothetical protein